MMQKKPAILIMLLAAGVAIVDRTPAAQSPAPIVADLVAANRILADLNILDGYGHVSVRDPGNPNRYLMSRSLAPELVTAADVMAYDLDSNPVDAQGRSTYRERFIHGEV